jgi:hypothetical protein
VHQSIRARESLALSVPSPRPRSTRRAAACAARGCGGVRGRVPSTRVRESAAPSAGTAAGQGARLGFARSFPPRQTPAGDRRLYRT